MRELKAENSNLRTAHANLSKQQRGAQADATYNAATSCLRLTYLQNIPTAPRAMTMSSASSSDSSVSSSCAPTQPRSMALVAISTTSASPTVLKTSPSTSDSTASAEQSVLVFATSVLKVEKADTLLVDHSSHFAYHVRTLVLSPG